MVAFRDGLKQTITRPDWTLLSLSMYLALPFVWWTVSMERFPFLSSLVIDYVISILVWSVGLIACLRSRVSWQKALCLQLGLMLAPNTADLVSHIFWSDARWWQNIWPFPPWIIPVIFLTFGLPWLGLMFAPALLLPFHRLMFSPRFFSPSMERNPPFSWKESDSKRTLLLWVGATCAGLAIPIIPLPIPIRVLVVIFLTGFLQ